MIEDPFPFCFPGELQGLLRCISLNGACRTEVGAGEIAEKLIAKSFCIRDHFIIRCLLLFHGISSFRLPGDSLAEVAVRIIERSTFLCYT